MKLLVSAAPEELGAAVLSAFPGASAATPFHPVAQLVLSVAPLRDRKAVSAGLARIRRAQSQQHANAVLDALEASTWQDAPVAVQMCRAAIRHWQGIYALPKRARERVARGEDAAWALHLGVSRALARHGQFQSAESAAAFAQAWLLDTEQRQRRRALVLRHRASVAAARAAG